MLGNIHYALVNKKVLIIFFILTGLIFQPLNLLNIPWKVVFALMNMAFIMVGLYALLSSGRIHKVLLLAIFSLFPSVIFGMLLLTNNETNVIDFFADVVRYVAPFIGFSVAIFLVRKMNFRDIESLFVLLFSYEIFKMLLSIFNKLLDSGNIVEYAGVGFYSSAILVIVFGFNYFFKGKRTILIAMLFLLSISLFILMPFIIVSKTNVLVMITQSVIILYLIYQHIRFKINKLKYFIGLFLIALIVPTLIGSDNQTINRYEQALNVVVNPDIPGDTSTTARIGEIQGVFHNFSEEPMNFIFGMGNGSWILAKFIDEDRKGSDNWYGLAPQNYRENGKYVHHIHSGIFSILNRNGLIGLLFYFYFFYFGYRHSKKFVSFGRVRYLDYSKESTLVYLYGLGSVAYLGEIVALLPNNGMYGSLFWGVKVAMIPIAFKYLNLKYKAEKR